MSMGPSNQDEVPQPSAMDRVTYHLKKAGGAYFGKPFHYLFYTLLLVWTVTMVFGKRLHWEFYALLLGLGIVQLLEYLKQNPSFPKLWKRRNKTKTATASRPTPSVKS